MPRIKTFHRCRIEMYFDDHPPPHFHVITRGDERLAIAIETLTPIAGEADSRDTFEAFDWAKRNKVELRARWKQYSEPERAAKKKT